MRLFSKQRVRSVEILFTCWALIGTVTILSSQQVAAEAAACEISRETNSAVSGRAGSVVFSDGRTITVVGHSHGETKIVAGLDAALADRISSNQEVEEILKKRIGILQEPIADFKGDRDYLLGRLNGKSLQWTAEEAGADLMEYMDMRTYEMWTKGKENLVRRKLNKDGIFDDAILAYAGPARFVKLTHPEFRKTFTMSPVEDDAIMQASLDSVTESANQRRLLLERLPTDHPLRTGINNLFSYAFGHYAEWLKFSDEQNISNVDRLTPPELRPQMHSYVRALLKSAHLLRARDEMTLQKLLANEGSGIYFVGHAHLNSQLELLQEACRKKIVPPETAESSIGNR